MINKLIAPVARRTHLTKLLPASLLTLSLLSAPHAGLADSIFTISADGREVTDSRTGLIWQRCPLGMTWDAAANLCQGTASQYMWYTSLHVAVKVAVGDGLPWRIPNVKELSSLVDHNQISPALDPVAFPMTDPIRCWSSTPYANDAFYAWLVDFYDGSAYNSYLEDYASLRLVRDAP